MQITKQAIEFFALGPWRDRA